MLAVLALSGCGSGSAGPADLPPAPATVAPLVVLVRYGGIAGVHEEVSVSPAGLATVRNDRAAGVPRMVTLAPADLAALRTALERSGIATLQRNYLDPRAADAFQYDVTYQGVTVTADEGVIPATLRPVVDQLTPLLRAQ
jgi:hypothetical protein